MNELSDVIVSVYVLFSFNWIFKYKYLNTVCNLIDRLKFIQNVQRFYVRTLSVCYIGKNKTKMSYNEKFINVLSRSYNKSIERKAIHTYVSISKCLYWYKALYWYKFRIGTVLNLLQTEFHSDFVSFFRMQFWLLRSVYNSGQKWNETT